MRLLHLIPSFGGGGAERQLSLMAKELANNGLDVHVGYCRGGFNLREITSSCVITHELKASGNYDISLPSRVFKLVRLVRPDIVQTWLLQMDILGGTAALLNRVPLIVSERSSSGAYSNDWKNRWRRIVGRRAARIVANSAGGLEYWRPLVHESRLKLVRNCVTPSSDVDETDGASLESSVDGKQVVLFAGRFSYEKNIPTLIDALLLVAERDSGVVILMFGEGPEHGYAVERISRAGLGHRIILAGHSAQLDRWMRRAAVCVSVSTFEGHPNVVIEAAAAGCPLVLSDIAAHRELFNESSALFARYDSPSGIASAVVESLRNPTQARQRAKRAGEIASQFNLQTMVAAYRSIYEDILRQPR